MALTHIKVRGAKEHNLKNIDVTLPRDKLIVVTGLSGSGKSSLAFDTIYAEGQRRYVESLSAYARQFLGQMEKPNVESIEGLGPTIAIEQRQAGHNPRSTVATTTEIYDHLRLLFARVGQAFCPVCGDPVQAQSAQQMVETLMTWPEGSRCLIMAPVIQGKKGEHKELLARYMREGYVRCRINGKVYQFQEVPELEKNKKHTIELVLDRVVIKKGIESRLIDSVETALEESHGLLHVWREIDGKSSEHVFSQKAFCPKHPEADMADMEPRTFSFNSPYGACPECHGLGTEVRFDLDLVIQDPSLSLAQGAITPWAKSFGPLRKWYMKRLRKAANSLDLPFKTPWKDLSAEEQGVLLHGTKQFPRGKARFEGILAGLMNQFRSTESDSVKTRLMQYMNEQECRACDGGRLRPFSRAVKVGGKAIQEVGLLTITQAYQWIQDLQLDKQRKQIAEVVVKEIQSRLKFMADVGIGYLNLNRKSGTLSGGEAQRIRLATQVGSGLVGVCYVLDEPSIGLHQRDNNMLIKTLQHLRDIGNTVIVVEHDEETIRSSDYLLDLGPEAGDQGGKVCYAGPSKQIEKETTLTADYLSGRKKIALPGQASRKLSTRKAIRIKNASEHNLKNINVAFPLGGFICVSGVSGSGKSTLISDILAPALINRLNGGSRKVGKCNDVVGWQSCDKCIEIDQKPIGRTPRSNIATYTDIFNWIRALFTQTPEAKLRGYKPGRFSFNVPGGRCEACEGQGVKQIEMHFLPDIHVVCEECKGARYNRETLEVKWKGKNIAEVLEMRVAEALEFFKNHKKIQLKLQTLFDVGLSYIKLGQPATTLSGGEAQRIKLASELGRPDTGHTFYILDEPTTGLHFHDVQKLLEVLERLVEKGNTVLVIEHNLDVLKCADWIIDLGPEGGDKGGEVIAMGSPDQIMETKGSHTGIFLTKHLNPKTSGQSRKRSKAIQAKKTRAKKTRSKKAAKKTTPKTAPKSKKKASNKKKVLSKKKIAKKASK